MCNKQRSSTAKPAKMRLLQISFVYTVLLLFLFQGSVTAVENSALDEVLEGFDDTQDVNKPQGPAAQTTTRRDDKITKKNKVSDRAAGTWTWRGYTQTSLSYNYAHSAPLAGQTDQRGLSQFKQSLQLEISYPFSNTWKALLSGHVYRDFRYGLRGREMFTPQVLENDEQEMEFREVMLRGSVGPALDIRIGRQLVVWGKSDNIRVVDILNPLDNREPGMTDLEDLRLPLSMLRLDYYVNKWSLQGILIPEIRFNKNPSYGSEFYPLPIALPDDVKPNGIETALRLAREFRGWDLSLHAAHFYNDQAHFESGRLRHSRLSMLGVATNKVMSSWLLKGEAAIIDGLKFSNDINNTYTRLDALLGIEYNGLTDIVLAMEFANRHIMGFKEQLKNIPDLQQKDQNQTALRYQHNFAHDTWHLLIVALVFGDDGNDATMQRAEIKYDLSDAMYLALGAMVYQSRNHPLLGAFGDNDRIFTRFRYSF